MPFPLNTVYFFSELGFNVELIEQRVDEWRERKTVGERCNDEEAIYASQKLNETLAYPIRYHSDPFSLTPYSGFHGSPGSSCCYYTSPRYDPDSSVYYNKSKESDHEDFICYSQFSQYRCSLPDGTTDESEYEESVENLSNENLPPEN
jgi:hypothetical protein